ncbi:MAG: hypothetical protein ABR562_00705 [Thermoplasmatota archaeon]
MVESPSRPPSSPPQGWSIPPSAGQGFPGPQAQGFPGPQATQGFAGPAPAWPQAGWGPPPPQYRDASKLRLALVVMLPAYLVVDGVSMVLSWLNFQEVVRAASGATTISTFGGRDLLSLILSWTGIGLFIALAIVFGIWMARACTNATALTGRLPGSVGWAVGSWYIPIVGGFLAARPLTRLWERGPGGSKVRPLAWAILFALHQVAATIGFLVIFFTIFSQALDAGFAHAGDPDYQPSQDPSFVAIFDGVGSNYIVLSSVLLVVYALAAGFMIATVNAIQTAQQRLAAALPAWPVAR